MTPPTAIPTTLAPVTLAPSKYSFPTSLSPTTTTPTTLTPSTSLPYSSPSKMPSIPPSTIQRTTLRTEMPTSVAQTPTPTPSTVTTAPTKKPSLQPTTARPTTAASTFLPTAKAVTTTPANKPTLHPTTALSISPYFLTHKYPVTAAAAPATGANACLLIEKQLDSQCSSAVCALSVSRHSMQCCTGGTFYCGDEFEQFFYRMQNRDYCLMEDGQVCGNWMEFMPSQSAKCLSGKWALACYEYEIYVCCTYTAAYSSTRDYCLPYDEGRKLQ